MKNLTQEFGAYLNVLLSILFTFPSICVANEFLFNDQSYVEKECFDENYFSDTDDKVYVKPNNVYFSQHQIYVSFDGDLIPIKHLSCDRNGLFTSIEDIQMGRAMPETWECEKCGFKNYVGIDSCGFCGHDRYAKKGK